MNELKQFAYQDWLEINDALEGQIQEYQNALATHKLSPSQIAAIQIKMQKIRKVQALVQEQMIYD